MFFEIDGIDFPENKDFATFYNSKSKPLKGIGSLSRINIFVGPNNSGKSRFLRALFKQETFQSYFKRTRLGLMTETEVDNYILAFHDEILTLKNKFNLEHEVDYLLKFKESINITPLRRKKEEFNKIMNGEAFPFENRNPEKREIYRKAEEKLIRIKKQYSLIFNNEDHFAIKTGTTEFSDYQIHKIYIPSLRGLRLLGDSVDLKDHYHQRTIIDYFQNGKNNHPGHIFTGQTLYQDMMKHLLGNLKERNLIAKYQIFLSEIFFQNQEITLIPSIEPKVLNIKIGKEKERPIQDLGDGLQSLIILTFPLFQYQDEHLLLFIEEPELYLHPGMQRILLETYTSDQFKHVQYFIATHSNHLLDISIDYEGISIFMVRKEIDQDDFSEERNSKTLIQTVDKGDRNLLELLGVRNSSVFFSNCTIWVEGITDRLYLRHWIKLFIEKEGNSEYRQYKEDTHYSFVEYGGANITHYSFLGDEDKKGNSTIDVGPLCGKLFLITDNDSDKKMDRKAELEKALGERYKCLESCEIENTISEDVLKKVIIEYEKENISEDQLNSIKAEEYKNHYLGNYIDDKLNGISRRKYAAESGTIKDKVVFCNKVINNTKSVNDLSNEQINLCKLLYQFIESQNTIQVE